MVDGRWITDPGALFICVYVSSAKMFVDYYLKKTSVFRRQESEIMQKDTLFLAPLF